jgi:phosphoserine aminotransferase
MKNDKPVINFNAGPAALPLPVMEEASQAILNYNNTGLSILSIPHRGKLFASILEESKQLVKELCGLNDDYEILWLHGGGRLQFSMIPMNFLAQNDTAGYIDSGYWANDAIEYAKYYGNVAILSSSKAHNYNELPAWPADIPSGLAYLHFTTNNTISGTQWKEIPKTEVPLIADMSSDIFSKKTDYTNCDMFYAVAQKNIGAVGATLVVIKKEMLSRIVRVLPPMLNYAEHTKHNSILNTSPVFSIYTALLMLRWTKQKGIDTIEKENSEKAKLLYDEIHRNNLFACNIKHTDRSMMNVCFIANNKEREKEFINYCEAQNITGIEGHRKSGAFRVSLYNAISLADVYYLTDVMKQFEKAHQS